MSRSLKKKLFINEEFANMFQKHSEKYSSEPTKHPLIMNFRSSLILPEHVNYLFKVHNGKKYNIVFITTDMIGHKFGEFSLTRKLVDSRNKFKTLNKNTVKKTVKTPLKTKTTKKK
jgi:small subunit ribosomal protein S19